MKRLRLRVSNLLKVSVLALIFSVFLQASLASATGATELDQTNFYSEISVNLAGNYILVGPIEISTVVHTVIEGITTDSAPTGSTVFGTFIGTFTGLFNGVISTISGLTKPLFDVIDGDISDLNLASGTGEFGVIGNGALANILEAGGTIDNISFTGDVTGIGIDVGGLVGYSGGDISNSSATGVVTGISNNVGGLVGLTNGTIDNSYAAGEVYGGEYAVGGLVGYSAGAISNSYATGVVDGNNTVGGLVGESSSGITNSYATGLVIGIGNDVGGLVGLTNGTIDNSYAAGTVDGANDVGGLVGYSDGTITNSYATGAVTGTGTNNGGEEGFSDVGGLVGENDGPIINSYATGDVTGAVVEFTGRLYGFSDVGIEIEDSYGTGSVNGTPYDGAEPAPNILTILNTGSEGTEPFAVDALINLGRPYLISLEGSYDVVEEDTEETPSFNLRSYYTRAAKSLDKALISLGFKSNFSSNPKLGFQALEQNQSNSPAVIQLFEVSEYQNSNIILNKEDGLQLSISSYYKESVEIWTQGLNGEYLYLGLIEFDKDGKAILPTLKFDTANTYQLLMIKAADKLSEKPNLEAQLGQITINVI